MKISLVREDWMISVTATIRTPPAAGMSGKATWSAENPGGRWRVFTYDELMGRDPRSTWIFSGCGMSRWRIRANLPAPDVLAAEIIEDLMSATGTD